MMITADDPALVELAKALRAKPGHWLKWPLPNLTESQPYWIGSRITRQRTPGTPPPFRPDDSGSFRATVRDGQLYVCFVKAIERQR
jgi:hypothetical protein